MAKFRNWSYAQIGYFAQNQASLLDENATIFETIDDIVVGRCTKIMTY
jgi:hypothetical protein